VAVPISDEIVSVVVEIDFIYAREKKPRLIYNLLKPFIALS